MDFSFQLYGGRKFPPLDTVLGQVARLGYRQVEGYSDLLADADAVAAGLKRHGLIMPTAHFSLVQLQDTAACLKLAEQLGIRFLYCPAIPKEDREQGESKYVELAETLARLGETIRRAGFGFGWHNHDFEFEPLPSGRLPMDIILEGASNNEWEMDIAWIVRGGHDPIEWMKKHGKRINAVHIKDIAPAGQNLDEDGWADVGHGTLDWQALFSAIKTYTNTRYFIMEHDNPSDVERFARRSLAAVKALEALA